MPAQRNSPTLNDVARHAGVSLATASRAINGSTGRKVGPELAHRVRASALALGYAPDANAQAMARGDTRTIGVVVHDLTDPYFAAIADGLAQQARRHEVFMMVATTGNDIDALTDIIASFDSMRVKAIIVVGARWSDEVGDRLSAAVLHYRRRGGQVVALGMDAAGVDCIRVDNEGGARELASHVIAAGYRKPLLLTGPPNRSTAVARSRGLLERFAELGQPVPESHQISSDFTRSGGQQGLRAALDAGLDFDCIVAATDVMALGALQQARAAGLVIPRVAGLTGFGDISSLVDVSPGLTTVRVPTDELVGLAIQRALSGPRSDATEVTVPVALIVRESTPGPLGPASNQGK